MDKPTILIQLDCDAHASVFDAVVALDAGVDQLLQYGAVEPMEVRDLVHGAMFTRGHADLHRTAIFVGGSDVSAAEHLLKHVIRTMFDPMRVSVMFDANGANTTAAAAVLTAARHLKLTETTATVLAATGPVGERAVRMLVRAGAKVRVGSRSIERAVAVCERASQGANEHQLLPCSTGTPRETAQAIEGSQLVLSAAAAGVEVVPESVWTSARGVRVAIDLNAVPPVGIAGIDPSDHRQIRNKVTCYGAIGVGALKMKIHKAAIQRLFETNTLVLDAEEVYEIGRSLVSAPATN